MENILFDNLENYADLDYNQSWERIVYKLKSEYGLTNYNNWLSTMSLVRIEQGIAKISVKSNAIKNWITDNYFSKLSELIKEEFPQISQLELLTRNSQDVDIKQEKSLDNVIDATDSILRYDLNSDLEYSFCFENFIVDHSNELAYKSVMAVAQNELNIKISSPLFIYGGVGLGKTHLLHSAGHYVKENYRHKNVILTSANNFMYNYIRSMREKDIFQFKEQFRNVDLLLIDDIQFIMGKNNTLEEFFHIFNYLVERNKQIIITCDKSPSDLYDMGERARSRLGGGLVVDVQEPSCELRKRVIMSKIDNFKQKGTVNIDDEVIEMLSQKITSNIRELEGAINKLLVNSQLMNQHINPEIANKTLKDLLRFNEKKFTITEIQKIVSKHYKLNISDLTSSKKSRNVAQPRQIAIYLCKQNTDKSLSEIGKGFGKKDHTTIMHAIKKIEKLLQSDTEIASNVNKLQGIINNG